MLEQHSYTDINAETNLGPVGPGRHRLVHPRQP